MPLLDRTERSMMPQHENDSRTTNQPAGNGLTPDPAAEPTMTGPDAAAIAPPADRPSGSTTIKRTRISGTWLAIVVATIVLIFLLIFILQNLARATVYYLGAAGSLPLGVALLFAAVGGALLVALVGTARIFQLRRLTKKRDTQP